MFGTHDWLENGILFSIRLGSKKKEKQVAFLSVRSYATEMVINRVGPMRRKNNIVQLSDWLTNCCALR